MASTNMKAVLTLTADASGVRVGINQAMKQLDRLNSAVGQLRGLAVANVLGNLFSGIASGVMDELKRLGELGRTYSGEGMAGAAQLAIAQQQSDQQLGQAFGGITAAIDQATAQHLKDLTSYIVAHKDDIGQAMAAVAGFGMGLADITANALATFGELIDWVANSTPEKMAKDVGMLVVDTVNTAYSGHVGYEFGKAGIQSIYTLLYEKLGGD